MSIIIDEVSMMNENPHRSSIFDLEANIVAMLAYALPMLLNTLTGLDSITWLIPLLILLMEKNSQYVRYHGAQALAFFVMSAILSVVGSILNVVGIISSIMFEVPLVGWIPGTALSIGMIGIVVTMAVISIILLVYEITSAVKAYNYIYYEIPVVTRITDTILRLFNR